MTLLYVVADAIDQKITSPLPRHYHFHYSASVITLVYDNDEKYQYWNNILGDVPLHASELKVSVFIDHV